MALELVCVIEFWHNRQCKTSPADLAGLWGPSLAENLPHISPQVSGQTDVRYTASDIFVMLGRRTPWATRGVLWFQTRKLSNNFSCQRTIELVFR